MQWAKKYFTVLCDDLREETGNKMSIMGAYADKMVFKELPALLPKLALAIFLEDLQKKIPGLRIKIKNPEMKPVEIDAASPPIHKIGDNINIAFSVIPFRVKAPGDAAIEVFFGKDKRPSIIHRFKIELHGNARN